MSQNQRHVIYKHREDKCQNHRGMWSTNRERTDVTAPQRHVVYKMSRVTYGAIPEWLTFWVT